MADFCWPKGVEGEGQTLAPWVGENTGEAVRVWKLTGLERPEAAYLSYAGWDLSSDMGETVSNSEPQFLLL